MKNIEDSIAEVRKIIHQAELQYQRPEGSVQLLAISKTRPAAAIKDAIATGQYDFGENYLQEALDKISLTGDPRAIWHFVGPLQSNKTRAIAENFNWVHSLDRLKIAQRLNDARPALLPPLNVLIQINISGEASKAGIAPQELSSFINGFAVLKRLRLRGLMALPEPCMDFEQQRRPLRRVKQLFDTTRATYPQLDTLSMGTTSDMVAAIAEGTTLVRIGTAIFGARM